GIVAARRPGDTIITGHRCHGFLLACGIEPEPVMAELLGRESGISGGLAGSMHLMAPEVGFYGGHAVPGAQVGLGLGLAFAAQKRGQGEATILCYGDALARRGGLGEYYALAAAWRLPAVFVIENNAFNTAEALDRLDDDALRTPALAQHIPAEAVDGMDVEAVTEATTHALAHVRAGQGPFLLEMRSFRYRGHHALSAAESARHRDAAAQVRRTRDPLERLRQRLLQADPDHATALAALERSVKARIAAAAAAARTAPEPAPETLHTHVLAPQPQHSPETAPVSA
ncbi:MAG: thiamine pyrophosphate-dependent enzyme, partial [Pseudomonadota bacterium]